MSVHVTVRFFSIIVTHGRGTTILIPRSGHVTRATGSHLSTGDNDVELKVVRTGANLSGTTDRSQLMSVTELPKATGATANVLPGLVSGAFDSSVLAARILLPTGTLTDEPLANSDFSASQWYVPGVGGQPAGPYFTIADTVRHETALAAGDVVTLVVNGTNHSLSPATDHFYEFVNGDEHVSEAGCPEVEREDPFRLTEFPTLAAIGGISTGTPETILPPALAAQFAAFDAALAQLQMVTSSINYTKSGIAKVAFGGGLLSICRPCPVLCVDLGNYTW